ncbi:MAG: hypothetical protein ACHQ2Y_07305 [Candidatus Lutacidiplasmatales archaeon]
MVDRHKSLIEFVTAWADYEKRLSGAAMEARRLAEHDPALHQMIARITGDLESSPDAQRQLAMRLAIAEFSKAV